MAGLSFAVVVYVDRRIEGQQLLCLSVSHPALDPTGTFSLAPLGSEILIERLTFRLCTLIEHEPFIDNIRFTKQ